MPMAENVDIKEVKINVLQVRAKACEAMMRMSEWKRILWMALEARAIQNGSTCWSKGQMVEYSRPQQEFETGRKSTVWTCSMWRINESTLTMGEQMLAAISAELGEKKSRPTWNTSESLETTERRGSWFVAVRQC